MEPTPSSGHLSEFNPLSAIVLPGDKTISATGLTLIVGPNSCGKTQFLKDVHASLIGQPRELVVTSKVTVNKPRSFDALTEALQKEGYIRRQFADNGAEVIKVRTVPLGGSAPGIQQQMDVGTLTSWFNSFSEGQTNTSSQSFYSTFGAMLSTALFLANRLTATNQTENFDYEIHPPKNDLQALYFNSLAQDELTQLVRDTFGKGIWVDSTRGGLLCFRVSNSSELPPADERLRPDKVTCYRLIDQEGDGLRSFVAICMSLALSRRPVCLIDEPEICLHPPQAYELGRVIGRQTQKHSASTLVATHSSHVLRGVIQETKKLQIIRLTRSNGQFAAHLVDSELLAKAIEKPLVRTEAIFDGLFADGVVLVESDGDRAVYQAVWESIPRAKQLDLLFLPVNGKGPMADIATFFKALQIPIAVVPDLDLIGDDGVIPRLLSALSADDPTSALIREKCRNACAAIRKIPPTITPDEVNGEVQRIACLKKDWQSNDDEAVIRSLRDLASEIDRMRKMKKGGIEAYRSEHPAIAGQLEEIKNLMWKCGVFIVPVGELECWLSDEFMSNGPSREKKKQLWAEEAAGRIRRQPANLGEIAQFVTEIARYLAEKEAALG